MQEQWALAIFAIGLALLAALLLAVVIHIIWLGREERRIQRENDEIDALINGGVEEDSTCQR